MQIGRPQQFLRDDRVNREMPHRCMQVEHSQRSPPNVKADYETLRQFMQIGCSQRSRPDDKVNREALHRGTQIERLPPDVIRKHEAPRRRTQI